MNSSIIPHESISANLNGMNSALIGVRPELNFKLDLSLKTKLREFTISHLDEPINSLENLLNGYDCISEIDTSSLSSEDIAIIEEYKLSIMQATSKFVKSLIINNVKDEDIETLPIVKKLIKYLLFSIIFIGALIWDAIGHFIAALSIFTLIPFISATTLLISALSIAAFNTIIFIAFDAKLLGKSFNIDFLTKRNKNYETLENQIKITQNINFQLLKTKQIDHLSNSEIIALEKLIILFNKDLLKKSTSFTPYVEKPLKKVSRYIITALGLVTVIGGNYFFSTTALGLIAPSVFATPIGLALVATCITVSIALYFSKGAINLYYLMNPNDTYTTDIKKKFVEFSENSYVDKFEFKSSSKNNFIISSYRNFQNALIKENIALRQIISSQENVPNDSIYSPSQSTNNSQCFFHTRPRSKSNPLPASMTISAPQMRARRIMT
jgi:hypothetical protein